MMRHREGFPSLDDIAREFAAIEARDYNLTIPDYDSARPEKIIAWQLKCMRVIRAIITARVTLRMKNITNDGAKSAPNVNLHEIN